MTSAASPGDRMPAAQLCKTAPDAATASAAVSILGRSNATARSRRGGSRRSTQSRNAATFPSSAIATTLRVSASASSSIRASIASVALLRAPFGRPLGLPLWPGSNGRPRGFATSIVASELWSIRESIGLSRREHDENIEQLLPNRSRLCLGIYSYIVQTDRDYANISATCPGGRRVPFSIAGGFSAAAFRISRTKFGRCIFAVFSATLTDPLHANQKVSTIALDIGFGDLSYFNRAFRRRYGMTPSELRTATRSAH